MKDNYAPEPAPEPDEADKSDIGSDNFMDAEMELGNSMMSLMNKTYDNLDEPKILDRTLSNVNENVLESLRNDMHKLSQTIESLEREASQDDTSSISGCSPRPRLSATQKAARDKLKAEAREAKEFAKKKKKRKFEHFVFWEESELYENENETDKSKWTKFKRYRFQRCLWKLKYNRIVSTFYLDNLKRREGRWSWMIIFISTITSGLTVANNVDDEPIDNYNTFINALLTVSSMSTSLIAAWIKKQTFIERINETDKYLLNINVLCEELEIQFSLLDKDRATYEDFKKKYIPEITKYMTTNPMIPPNEWKSCIREITLKYPELVDPDNTEENKLWPWYGDFVLDTDDYNKEAVVRNPTTFMEHFKMTNTDKLRSSCCFRMCKPKDIMNVY